MRSALILAMVTAVFPPLAAAEGEADREVDREAEATMARRQKHVGAFVLALGAVSSVAAGVLFHRAATACERWSRDETNDERHLCFGAEIGYGLLGTGVGAVGAMMLVTGVLVRRTGSRRLDALDRDRRELGLDLRLGPDGGFAGVRGTF